MSVLNTAHLGPTSYREGLALQEALVAALATGRARDSGSAAERASDSARGSMPAAGAPHGQPGDHDWLLYPDHPPVLTVGRSPSDGNLRVPRETLASRGIEVFEVARGGDITWHGPGQLVGYTICDLDRLGHDLHRFLRDLEQALLDALAGWGIEGRRVPGRTGIWVGEEKIASIGVAVRRWVTYHGFALNVCSDLSGFELIHPCGLHGIRMTTVARLLGDRAPSLDEARRVTAETVARRLGYAGAAWKPAESAWMAAANGDAPVANGAVDVVESLQSHERDTATGGEFRPPAV